MIHPPASSASQTQSASRWHDIAEFLALRRNTLLLLITLVLAGTGERFWLGFAPEYLETLGAGVHVIGLFDALQTLLGAVFSYLIHDTAVTSGSFLGAWLWAVSPYVNFTFVALCGVTGTWWFW